MSSLISRPIESLLRAHNIQVQDVATKTSRHNQIPGEIEFLIIGSGYGAAMAALALAEHNKDAQGTKPGLVVFERGEEYTPNDFPKTLDHLPSYLNFVSKNEQGDFVGTVQNKTGLWEIRAGEGVSTLTGSGLGGTSLVNANVAMRTPQKILDRWPLRPPGKNSWSVDFDTIYPKIEALLGVTTVSNPTSFEKFNALSRTAIGLGSSAEPAPVAINFDGTGPHSVDTGACNACGNCVVGCHSGAKQSLNLNAWPLVKDITNDDASLYTGVTVLSLQKAGITGTTWRVHCALTRDPQKQFSVLAHNVILAAGTIGSVDILKRSEAVHGLTFSSQLGKKFSTNGDALISSVGQSRQVNAISDIPGLQNPPKEPGPTIIGKASINLGNTSDASESFTLEEGAIPYPLIPLWQEMIVTQSFFQRYADDRLSAWHKVNKKHDYLAISPELNDHSQVLLVMGDDRGLGELKYDPVSDTTTPNWTVDTGEFDFFDTMHRTLRQANENAYDACFDGGQYHPNIMWKPIPDGFADAVEGAEDLGGMLLSVHPLGGGCMGANAAQGVVNTSGEVFSGTAGTAVHKGLFVLDGAIIPGAIGTNPFLTIAAASYLLAHDLAQRTLHSGPALGVPFPLLNKAKYKLEPPPGNPIHPVTPESDREVRAVFRERLVHYIGRSSQLPWSVESPYTIADFNRLFGNKVVFPNSTQALVLDVEFGFEDSQHLENWMKKPNQVLPAKATLYYDPVGSVLTINPENLVQVARLKGEVNLGKIDEPNHEGNELSRLVEIGLRFLRYRKDELGGGDISDLDETLRVAKLHTNFRSMNYAFDYDPADPAAVDLRLKIRARKQIEYTNNSISLWGSLMRMSGTLETKIDDNKRKEDFDWEVDAVDITRGPAPLQVLRSPKLVNALSKVAGILAFFFRVILQTHFWSFGAASYDKHKTLAEIDNLPGLGRLEPPPGNIRYGSRKSLVSQPKEEKYFPGDNPANGPHTCRLVRYQPANDAGDFNPANRKALLLVHGLAHSSRIFWTHTIAKKNDGQEDKGRENFVQYFLERNYDVWILDHRTSANYVKSITPEHRWDDIALTDIPWAVKTVFETINPAGVNQVRKVHLFSHCIGAGAASIAVLQGLLNFTNAGGQEESMIASLVPHAVAPWLFASVANRARENIWAMFKDAEPIDVVEPCPHKDTPMLENIFDRIATSTLTESENDQWHYSSVKDDIRGPMFPRTIYTRYTIIWGRQWVNENINRATRNEFGGMIGAVPRDVLQQVYSSIVRGLLSNHDGNNVYVVKDRIDKYWTFPTLFIHGNRNTVFDMESSRKSAEMLTRHREFSNSPANFWNDITPQTYCRNNVWIDVVDGYGHMDMILGRDAFKDDQVFSRLHRFFEAAELNTVDATYRNEFTSPQEMSEFKRTRGAQSPIGPSKRPLTGPIISRPELITQGENTGKVGITIWVEAQDFSSIPVDHIYIDTHLVPDIITPFAFNMMASGVSEKILHETLEPMRFFERGRREFQTGNNMDDVFWITNYGIDTEQFGQSRKLRYLWVDYDGLEIPPQDPIKLDWDSLDWLRRLAVPGSVAENDPELSFLLGSCLYPGSTFDREQMSQVFTAMYEHVIRVAPHPETNGSYRRGVDHVLFVGDQIYGDATANMMDPITGYEKYRVRYRNAFANAPARQLLSHVPSYFAVDDHEYSDNFQGFPVNPPVSDLDEFVYAKDMAFQFLVHDAVAWLSPPQLWYDFSSAGFPFFNFDSRFERQSFDTASRGSSTSMMSNRQLDDFAKWVGDEVQKGSPVLFIATGSPLAPVTRAQYDEPYLLQGGDSLLGYPGFLQRVVEILHASAPDTHVCWLTGDPHLSCFARIKLDLPGHRKSAQFLQVCASGLYEPLSFINENPRRCDWNTGFRKIPLSSDLVCEYDQYLLSEHPQHFLRLDLKLGQAKPVLTLSTYSDRGNSLAAPATIELEKVG